MGAADGRHRQLLCAGVGGQEEELRSHRRQIDVGKRHRIAVSGLSRRMTRTSRTGTAHWLHVSASLVLGKVGGVPATERVGAAVTRAWPDRANTVHARMDSEPRRRRRGHLGLNKGETRNSLARAVFFYRRGAVLDRLREDLQNKASVASIALWITVCMEQAVAALERQGTPVPADSYGARHRPSLTRSGCGGRWAYSAGLVISAAALISSSSLCRLRRGSAHASRGWFGPRRESRRSSENGSP